MNRRTLSLFSAAFLMMLNIGALLLSAQQTTADHPASEPKKDPASIGIALDNSGSMAPKRKAAIEALEEFVKISEPDTEFFVVNFNNLPYLDQGFTTNTDLVDKALRRADAHAGTALYDAVVASVYHFRKAAKYKQRALVLLTDGLDNASRFSIDQLLAELKKPDTPAIYCIGMFAPKEEGRGRKVLNVIAQATGGAAFYPRNPQELKETVRKLAEQIRKQSVTNAP
jgi:Ca-activated chloride channel homolog